MVPEIQRIEQLSRSLPKRVRHAQLGAVHAVGEARPIHGFILGPNDRTLPTFGLFAGVHGLERVGAEVAISFLESLLARLEWDKSLQDLFDRIRLISIPLINPGGLVLRQRSNPNGVDLMRNAPIDADETATFLVGGHRLGPWLPWYRGDAGCIEPELQALLNFVQEEGFESRFLMTLDVHSGFGLKDRLWYPHAYTTKAFPIESQALKFKDLLDRTYPYHVYQVESQATQYLTHGDAWDYLFERHFKENQGEKNRHGKKIYLPWALEMGSWLWIKKNPRQLFSRSGIFNPVVNHRRYRIMRRHVILLEFFLKTVASYENWALAR